MIKQPIVPVALKEWAVNIEALANGTQILLMRKGGIHEETKEFQLKEEIFYLFPTYLHQKKELLKSEFQSMIDETLKQFDEKKKLVDIQYLAAVVEDIQLQDENLIEKLLPYHIWSKNFAETKLHWKKQSPLHVLLVRVYRLEQPIHISLKDEYNGCKSWVFIEEKLPQTNAIPVLTDEEFAKQVKIIHEILENGE
ncbi:DUF1802 family protein [Tepidibacillus fermentans]|uniref:DUF1802 family protein n=1 Tax=Tepidibacillus fermentans TaxID=1281767 RepID=A0A4V2URY8_9BACI|nr:DUF1802 family protein [Tepidibacillus fermentans]TCS79382.1 hypothetical protein EDD72_1216 [Tepidibacillus fermentans]